MSAGVEVPLTEDEVMYLRQMLMSPGYKVLLRFMDGKIEALEAAAQIIRRENALNPEVNTAFFKADIAREFRDHVNGEVMRVSNYVRGAEEADPLPGITQDQVLGMLEKPAPDGVTQWPPATEKLKYRH